MSYQRHLGCYPPSRRNCALIKCNRYIPREKQTEKGRDIPPRNRRFATQSGTLPRAHNSTLAGDPVRRLCHAGYTIIIWILLLRTYCVEMAYGVRTANTRDQIIGIQLTTTVDAMVRPSLSPAISPCLSVSRV